MTDISKDTKVDFLPSNSENSPKLIENGDLYLQVMWPQSGILYIASKPTVVNRNGMAKLSIAKSMQYNFYKSKKNPLGLYQRIHYLNK
ncbi:hypothetical protein ABIB62_002477 [Mucilaginibacter sp. UYP25]|uniref:hypothetical protein n=1 Tax=unclassified Mucilaginibacter TaxID=2617802 RepID=UPI0033992E6D